MAKTTRLQPAFSGTGEAQFRPAWAEDVGATLYYAIYPAAATIPTWDSSTGWSGTPIVNGSENSRSTSGIQTWASLAEGLDPATQYKIAFVWSDGTDISAVAYSDMWNTLSLNLVPILSLASFTNKTPSVYLTFS